MIKLSNVLIIIVLGMFATAATADETGCKGCDPQKQDSSHREQIKADRAKYDRENAKVTARPWDGMKNGQAPQGENK